MTSRAFTTGTGRHSPSFAFTLSLTISVCSPFLFDFWFSFFYYLPSFLRGWLSFFYPYIYYIFFRSLFPFHPYSTLFFHISLTLSYIHPLQPPLAPTLPPWPQGRTADRLCTPAAQGLFLRSICPSPSLWRLTQPNNISSTHTHMCAQTHTGINTCTH